MRASPHIRLSAARSGRRLHPRLCDDVHFPLRFPTPFRHLGSKGRTGSAWAIYKLGLPSSRNVSTKSEAPRIILGIQPTGIPDVRCFFSSQSRVHAMFTMISAQKLLWGACELDQVTVDCCAGDKLFLSIVGWHALTLPQDPSFLSEARTTMMALILASSIDPQRSVGFHQDEVTDSPSRCLSGFLMTCRIGPEPC